MPGTPVVAQRQEALNASFSPSSPIDSEALFAGRVEQRRDVARALGQKGQHAIIFGERGVGKTSLANIVAEELSASVLSVKITCDSTDSFVSIWRKVFSEIELTSAKKKLGFGQAVDITKRPLSEDLPATVTPDAVRKLLSVVAATSPSLIVIDEFDRIKRKGSALFADTIKTLSDHAVNATIALVGVADTVDSLMKEHASVERALVQVQMPRMSRDELRQIVAVGLGRASMSIDVDPLEQVIGLSQGLPHYTHLLAQLAGFRALDEGRESVISADVEWAIGKAVEKAHASTKSAHHKATMSPRKDNLYTQVLLACALASADSLGYFAAADVRDPMTKIMGRRYEIPAFSQHLNDFTGRKRGPVLQKMGTKRRYRFRFIHPVMQPYVIMHGLSAKLIGKGDV